MIAQTTEIAPGVHMGLTSPFMPGKTLVCGRKPVIPEQTHSLNVAEVCDTGTLFPDTDALVTTLEGVPVGVRTADCIPVLFHAPDIRAVAAAHAGWRGTVGGIAGKTADKLVSMGAKPENLQVYIYPGICLDCFEVGDEIAETFSSAGFGDFVRKGNFTDRLTGHLFDARKWHIDLAGVNERILTDMGVKSANISRTDICTRHTPLVNGKGEAGYLPSWRRESGTQIRMLSWIMLT